MYLPTDATLRQPSLDTSPITEVEASSTSDTARADEQPNHPQSPSASCAPVQRQSRVVRNARGKYGRIHSVVFSRHIALIRTQVYIGGSASLTFLHQTRRIVTSAVGPCTFADDVYLSADSHRHQMIETMPIFQVMAKGSHVPRIDVQTAAELALQFSRAAAGIIDLFDHESLVEQICHFVGSWDMANRPESPVLYLVLALGAQARSSGSTNDDFAESCFHSALCQAMTRLVDEPDVSTVQSFCMMTWYALTACRRSVAAIYLGIAAQAAHTIGLHRSESNHIFPSNERRIRDKAWTALRFCDVYMAASLGRPMLTSNIHRSDKPRPSPPVGQASLPENDQDLASVLTRLCSVFERILSEVYTKQFVTLQLGESIAGQIRACSSKLSDMLGQNDLGTQQQAPTNEGHLVLSLLSSNLSIIYHYSIVLLTSPFLTFKVTSHLKGEMTAENEDRYLAGLAAFSDACVTSAIETIRVAKALSQRPSLPKRHPLVINNVFMSALCLGVACFGPYDHYLTRLDDNLKQAVTVLLHFQNSNPQAARYAQIITQLVQAVAVHRQKREQMALQKSSQRFSNLFGEIYAHTDLQGGIRSLPDDHRSFEESSSRMVPQENDSNTIAGSVDANLSFPMFDWSLEYPSNISSGMYLATYEASMEGDPCMALDFNSPFNIYHDERSSIDVDPIMDVGVPSGLSAMEASQTAVEEDETQPINIGHARIYDRHSHL